MNVKRIDVLASHLEISKKKIKQNSEFDFLVNDEEYLILTTTETREFGEYYLVHGIPYVCQKLCEWESSNIYIAADGRVFVIYKVYKVSRFFRA